MAVELLNNPLSASSQGSQQHTEYIFVDDDASAINFIATRTSKNDMGVPPGILALKELFEIFKTTQGEPPPS